MPFGPHRSSTLRYLLGGVLAFLALNAAGGGIYGLSGARGIPAAWLAEGPLPDSFYGSWMQTAIFIAGLLVLALAFRLPGKAIRTKPAGTGLLMELCSVAADLPRFATAPLYRRWHLRWGATAEELDAAMPGDDLLPVAEFRCTRAITIDAPPEAVWPWLVQVGCLRGGFYSHDLLDNLGRPSARAILPELQCLKVGQWVPMSPTPSETTAFQVAAFEVPRWLLWKKPDSTWAWRLTATSSGRTRLVTRAKTRYQWDRPAWAALSFVLMEFGDFAMMRRMLLGIRDRAESFQIHG